MTSLQWEGRGGGVGGFVPVFRRLENHTPSHLSPVFVCQSVFCHACLRLSVFVCPFLSVFMCVVSLCLYRLVGLVVKASASRAEDPGFESRLLRDFFGVESHH